MHNWLLVTAMFVLSGGNSVAASFVLCESPDREDIVLQIDAVVFEVASLSCLQGDFVVDLSPCAPDGGWGLSAPMGTAGLVGVVDRWQDYASHTGGVVYYLQTPTEYRFEAGFGFSGEYRDDWVFTVSRLTGEGKLAQVQEVEENGEAGWSYNDYQCSAVERKF